ncbi:MAG: hypothetical protein ACRDSN_18625 [Pseudonocardiaceae bacterium]
MPVDESGREYQTYDEFMRTTDPATREPDTSPDNVARAVRYLDWWLPVNAANLGTVAHGDVLVLMAFARERIAAHDRQRPP